MQHWVGSPSWLAQLSELRRLVGSIGLYNCLCVGPALALVYRSTARTSKEIYYVVGSPDDRVLGSGVKVH